jgi:hypothetical protein
MSFGSSGQRAVSGWALGSEWAGPPTSGNAMTPHQGRTDQAAEQAHPCSSCPVSSAGDSSSNCISRFPIACMVLMTPAPNTISAIRSGPLHAVHGPYDGFVDSEPRSHIKTTRHAPRPVPPSPCPRSGPRARSGAEARGRVALKSVRLGRYQSQFFKMALPREARPRRGAPDPRSLLDLGRGHLPRAAER